MQAVVLTIHLLLALALILVVLLQRSEGGGLGIGGGGGVMTSRGAATALSKVTWAIGIAFVVTSLALTVLAARDSRLGLGDRRVGIEAPRAAAPPRRRPASRATCCRRAAGAGGDGPAAPPPGAVARRRARSGNFWLPGATDPQDIARCALPRRALSRID